MDEFDWIKLETIDNKNLKLFVIKTYLRNNFSKENDRNLNKFYKIIKKLKDKSIKKHLKCFILTNPLLIDDNLNEKVVQSIVSYLTNEVAKQFRLFVQNDVDIQE